MVNDSHLLNYFHQIYIINLPYRKDRLDEISEQLRHIGLSLKSPNIHLFSAIRPQQADEFPTVGTKGCFLSHLAVLKHALLSGHDRIVIIEDDLNFVEDFDKKLNHTINSLKNIDWSIFYGGYNLITPLTTEDNPIVEITPSTDLMGGHFVAFQKQTIWDLINYLELILTRKGGDPAGGPMHVDAAYACFRDAGYRTFIANPILGYQRASRTDISLTSWFDQVPIMRLGVALTRKLRNKLL